MSLRVLESILRRIYNVDEPLGRLIERAEQDPRLRSFAFILDYFRETRNRVAHPEKISSRLDAESTFSMTKRLILEILRVISP